MGTNAEAVTDAQSKAADLTSSIVAANGGSRDLNKDYSSAFYNMLTGSNSQMLSNVEANAKSIADASAQQYNAATEASAALSSESARRAMEQRLSNGGILGTDSGAGRAAIAQAIATPYAEAANKEAENYSNVYQNSLSSLLSGISSLSQQDIISPQITETENGWDKAGSTFTSLLSSILGGASGAASSSLLKAAS